jgi:hypothetical protein
LDNQSGGIDVCHGALTHQQDAGLSVSDNMLAMVFQLCQSAAQRWHRLRAAHYLPEVMNGMTFKDGLRVEQDAA